VAAVVNNIPSWQTAKTKHLSYRRKKPLFKTEGIWEEGADENIWTEKGWNDRRVEKTA
jgi:hypothetical protein